MADPSQLSEVRPGETVCALPERKDAELFFIGRISTPWKTRLECPKQGDAVQGPICRIKLETVWHEALAGVGEAQKLQILYWMHYARRDLLTQSPKSDGRTNGTFALRSPNRPNPVASSLVTLVSVEGNELLVRGLDCLDGTPVIDIKPEFCIHAP